MPATANYPNSLDFRNDMSRPLTWIEMDNMFRKPNFWEVGIEYSQGMVSIWDDSIPPVNNGATGNLSLWLCNTEHISATLWAPGTTFAYWDRIGGLSIPGPTGASGGPIGPTGLQGSIGTQGIQGPQGSIGSQGLQGLQGEQGLQGRQGILGNQGTIGTVGSPGSQGPQGIQGPTGIQGASGPQGIQGLQGIQGIQGLTGIQGFQGLQGLQGIQGNIGSQGIQGPTGIQGSQGIQGPESIVVDVEMDAINYFTNSTTPSVNSGNGLNVFFDLQRTGVTSTFFTVDNTNTGNQGTRIQFVQPGKYFINYRLGISISGATSRSELTTDLVWADGISSDQQITGFRSALVLDTNGLSVSNTTLTDTISSSGVMNITSSSPDWLSREIYVRVNPPIGGGTVSLLQDTCSISIVRLVGGAGPQGTVGNQGTIGLQGIQGISGTGVSSDFASPSIMQSWADPQTYTAGDPIIFIRYIQNSVSANVTDIPSVGEWCTFTVPDSAYYKIEFDLWGIPGATTAQISLYNYSGATSIAEYDWVYTESSHQSNIHSELFWSIDAGDSIGLVLDSGTGTVINNAQMTISKVLTPFI
jgi:hypothetical protein